MFGAKWVKNSTNENFCIFDIPNVNKYMFKNSCFISNPHTKDRNIYVSLDTFNSVIINSRKFPLSNPQIFLRAKGFQAIGSLFFMVKISLY